MKKYFWLTFLLVFFSGCRKKNPELISGAYYLPKEVKDYTLFMPGTYWIYQDSISGIEDSVYVINYSGGIDTIDINSDNSGKEIVEYFGYETKRTYDNATFYYSSNTSFFFKCIESDEKRPCFWTNRDKYYPGNYIGGGFCFLYDFYIGFSSYTSLNSNHSRIEIIKKYDSMLLNGIIYSSVIQYNDNKNISENDNRTSFYFSKNIGIIRKELLDSNQTWNLIRYNIVQ